MIEYWSRSGEADRAAFEPFRAAIQRECPDVRFAWIGGNLMVVGTVRSYRQKAYIDSEAEGNDLTIQNCVRVVPGRELASPDVMPIAS